MNNHSLPVPAHVVFDKDGTLIDFHAMWSDWLEGVAHGLTAGAGQPLTPAYLAFAGYDAAARRTLPGGRLALLSMADFFAETVRFLDGHGVAAPEQVAAAAWSVPDPIHTAHPIMDLGELFTALRGLGCRLTVATSDDHYPAVATLENLGVLHHIEAIVGADDGLPIKPAPDAVLALCQATGLAPERTLVVGDSLTDMLMAKAAGATAVGVLTGITPAAQLAPAADRVIDGIHQLLALFEPPAAGKA